MNKSHPSVKAAVLEVLNGLPDDASWDDVVHALYARRAIDQGLESLDAGRRIPYSDVLKEPGIRR